MDDVVHQYFGGKIPGVKPAEQNRSRLLQEKFVTAGREILMDTRLEDIPIPELAKAAGSSVGGFYARFDSKDAFFDFMRMRMFIELQKLHDKYLDPAQFQGKSHADVSAGFVDLMVAVFSGPWRGVLRESFYRIPEHAGSWEPMKRRSLYLTDRVFRLLEPLVDNRKGLEERVAVAIQFLLSAFDNEMMNPNLAYRISNPKFRFYLSQSFDALIAGNFNSASSQTD